MANYSEKSEHTTHINMEFVCLAKQIGNDLYLETGEFIYPFEFLLPNSIPATIEIKKSKTQYVIYPIVEGLLFNNAG